MRFTASAVASAALMAGAAVADPLTTITPCPAITTTTIPPITVTEQYQTVSTCATASANFQGSWVTTYPLETFAYVSTVIPAAWDGTAAQPSTITVTDQEVIVSRFHTTITKTVTPTVSVTQNGTIFLIPSPTPIALTIAKDFYAAYDDLGPLAIPGYGGSGLSDEGEVQADGSRSQVVDVIEYRAGPGGYKVVGYEETWISKPAPAVSSTTVAPVSTQWVAPSAGDYTFTFTLTAPSNVITVETETITVAPSPYYAFVTHHCDHAWEVIDITETITETIYWTLPVHRIPPSTVSPVPYPTGPNAFPWFPKPTPNLPGSGSGPDPFGWADWGNDDVTDPSFTLPAVWADWATETTTVTATVTPTIGPTGASASSSSSSSTSASSASYASSASSSSSTSSGNGIGPIGGSTSSSASSASSASSTSSSLTSASSASSASSSSSTSSGNGIGPIGGSTSSSASSTSSSLTSASSASSTSSSLTSASSASSTSSSLSSESSASSTSSSLTSASSASSTSSSLTSASSASSASSTSSAASSTTSGSVPATTPFYITSNTVSKYRKRALVYIGFEDEDAVLVSDVTEAALFYLDTDGFLLSGGLYVLADYTQPYIAFQLSSSKPSTLSPWSLSSDGQLTVVDSNDGFCVSTSSFVFILFSQQPPFACNPIVLFIQSPNVVASSTTTTTVAATTTTSEPTTTTTSVDVSGDLDADLPTATPVRRGVQYGGRKYYHHRH